MKPRPWVAAVALAAILVLLVPVARADSVTTLLDGTAVLLSQTSGGGNGGNTSSTTSSTNIFSPSAFVDYKRFGGEPTVTVDRYPFPVPTTAETGLTLAETIQKECPGGVVGTSCYKDIAYGSSPNGFVYPHYSHFFKSDDLGQSFRVPQHSPVFGNPSTDVHGGGDSHQAVGEVTHKVFFLDLPGPGCVTVNTSANLGESFTTDPVGCGLNPGVIDDRQWVETDETFPGSAPPTSGNVYISFINFSNLAAPTLALVRSTSDGSTGAFTAGNNCNLASTTIPTSVNFTCPDPADPRLWVAGPPVADKHSAVDKFGNVTRPATHWLYIPFIRANTALNGGGPWELWIARSKDGGVTWNRFPVAVRGVHDPGNIFPELTIDTSGNLYYTWAETKGPSSTVDQTTTLTTPTANRGGETDVFYAYSPPGGEAWSPPIPLTQENNDSAVFPWMVAGDAGQVDLVYYKANNGLNPNLDFADANGNACTEGDVGCNPNPAVWNVYFAQSQNALNTGSNFKSVQISDHPNHIGQICTQGLACSGDRDLLDFFTVDLDHLGAANVMWADDNTTRTTDTRNKFSRQLSGNSVFKNQTINLLGSWPISDHAVTDRGGDVFDPAGFPKTSCPGMDVLGAGATRSGDLITISLTLNGAPTAAKAIACGATGIVDDGGVWGAEFWAAREPGTNGTPRSESFYIAYSDPPGGQAGVEGGRVDNVNALVTSLEFHKTTGGTLGGTCTFPIPPEMPPFTNTTPCTITMTVSASTLGIKSGAGLYSITGFSTYFFGTGHTATIPGTRIEPGNSEQADAATPFDINGTGTTG